MCLSPDDNIIVDAFSFISFITSLLMMSPLQDMVDTTMLISQLKFITALQTDTHAHPKCAYGYISNIWECIAFFVITLFVLFAFIWNCFFYLILNLQSYSHRLLALRTQRLLTTSTDTSTFCLMQLYRVNFDLQLGCLGLTR